MIYTFVILELLYTVDMNVVGLCTLVHCGTFPELWKVVAMERHMPEVAAS
jgi:hypothetical protein